MPTDSPGTIRSTKRRRHGYRGYGSPLRHEHAGSVHWGTGFGGVGFARDGALLPPQPDLLPEELRERLPRRNGSD
ncbi:MAG TPA: hypothetical protein VKH43_13840 [Thermoanaerobaculia bacterium]|nr:hypothetical protein [Thermoanaerobaculia bacterium]